MEKKIPYYMAYPMPLLFDDEKIERRDFEYMKSLYPDTAKRLLPYVEEECDRMEYIGSMMFDEYPDQLQLRLMCRRIMEKVMDDMGRDSQNNGIGDLIWVLTWQEILKRRREYRKYRSKFY
jgi:hypothetical protein